jgi:hypothetical protein
MVTRPNTRRILASSPKAHLKSWIEQAGYASSVTEFAINLVRALTDWVGLTIAAMSTLD